jgi:predicted ATPase/DNA-binding SARP family transcriptional activator
LRLFGIPVHEAAGGRPVTFIPERRFQLLAYLACRRSWTSRDELADLLWPERTQGVARSNLRKVVMAAQQIDGLMPLERQGELLRWIPDSDLQQFERACAERRHADALALYRPPLMEGLDTGLPSAAAEWLAFERQRVAGLWRAAAAARLAELHDTPEAVVELGATLLALDPYDEAALCAHVEALTTLGQRGRAARALQGHAERLADEFGLEPPAAVRALAARLRDMPGDAPEAPAPTPAAGAAAPAGFIGRRAELKQLQELIASAECRLLTVTGTGGVGKSSLAHAALHELAGLFGGRGHAVVLEDLTETGQVPARIAAALTLELQGKADAWQQLAERLGERPTLLLLDNVEHLAGLAEPLDALLAACPNLKLLATSRNRLALRGEWLLPLDGLPLPDADETDAEVLRRNDAVRLFDERARAAWPSFRLDAQARDLVRLLHVVEGLPLAVELAAAWVRLMPVAEIVAEIERSLDLLDAGGTAGARHRGLRASFERSWSLLTDGERTSLAALAVLPGPFKREMAEQVAASPLPLLAALADKSLLRADGDGRFSLHPLVRQSALERQPDAEAVRARHAGYTARWLARLSDAGLARLKSMLDDVEVALPHIRAAWDSTVARGDPEVVISGARLLTTHFQMRGPIADGVPMFERAVAAFDERTPRHARALGAALRGHTALLYRRGLYAQAEASARRALKIKLSDQRRFLKISLNQLGLSLTELGRYREARHCFEQALRRTRLDNDPTFAAGYIGNIGMLEMTLGRYEASLERALEALAMRRANADAGGAVIQLVNAAEACQVMGRQAEARSYLDEGLASCREHGLPAYVPLLLRGLALNRLAGGDLTGAEGDAEQALSQARHLGDANAELLALLARAQIRVAQQRHSPALADALAALRIANATASPPGQLKCIAAWCQVLAARGDRPRAAQVAAWLIAQPALEASVQREVQGLLDGLASTHAQRAAGAPDVPGDGTLAGMVALMEGDSAPI